MTITTPTMIETMREEVARESTMIRSTTTRTKIDASTIMTREIVTSNLTKIRSTSPIETASPRTTMNLRLRVKKKKTTKTGGTVTIETTGNTRTTEIETTTITTEEIEGSEAI